MAQSRDTDSMLINFTDTVLAFIDYSKCTNSRVRFPMVSLEIFIDIMLPAALWLWG
jgi:hypothetical protein